MKYIDTHAHIFPENIAEKVVKSLEEYYEAKWECSGLVEDLLKSMHSAGVSKAVVFSSATKASQVEAINNYISLTQNTYSAEFIGFGTLHQDYPDYKNEIERMKSLGLHGIKFHPDFQQFYIDEPKMQKIYEEIGENFPVLFHVGDIKTDFSSPRRLANVLKNFPHITVIAAHLGGYSEWDEALEHVIGKNVYIDISSAIPWLGIDKARELIIAHGIDKTLFATDYPAVCHKNAIAETLEFGFSEADNEKIFYRNAEKLLGIRI